MIKVYGSPVNVTVHRTVFPKNSLNFKITGNRVSVTDLSGEFEHINGDYTEFSDREGNTFPTTDSLSEYLDSIFYV